MELLKLHNEILLISDLKVKAFSLIGSCEEIQPVKLLVESHDILELSLCIANKFPPPMPGKFEYDESAMTQLSLLTRQLHIFYHDKLPKPQFPVYKDGVARLLRLCNVPTGILIVG